MKIEDKAVQILNKKTNQIKPEYIKSGQTILGVEGTYEGLDTSDGTIIPENMVSGSIGYAQFAKVIGTMPQWRVSELWTDIVQDIPRGQRIKATKDMTDFISSPKSWVSRTDQLGVMIDYYSIAQATNILPAQIKKDEDILGVVGTYISPILETPEYETLLEKTDTILGESALYNWLEYVQSDGNQFIDTELPIDSNVKIEVAYEYVNSVDTNDTLLGVVYGNPETEPAEETINYQVNFENNGTFVYGDESIDQLSLNTINQTTTLKIVGNRIYKINNQTTEYERIGTLPKQTMVAPAYLYLFGLNNNGNISRGCAIKFHYCKIYSKTSNKEWNLERHFIPVQNKTTNTICLFDRINKVFYENVGTDDFIAGPEKNLDTNTVPTNEEDV